jgi:hypothetical protein
MAHLLAETDPRASIEREEYEGIGCEVFVQPLVQESVGIEFKS